MVLLSKVISGVSKKWESAPLSAKSWGVPTDKTELHASFLS